MRALLTAFSVFVLTAAAARGLDYDSVSRGYSTDEAPEGLPGNFERFSMMLDANNVPPESRKNMWGGTMAENLGIDPETHRFIE